MRNSKGQTRTLKGRMIRVWKDELFPSAQQPQVEPYFQMYSCETVEAPGSEFESDFFLLLDDAQNENNLIAEGSDVLTILGMSEADLKKKYEAMPRLSADELEFQNFKSPFVLEEMQRDENAEDGFSAVLYFYFPDAAVRQ